MGFFGLNGLGGRGPVARGGSRGWATTATGASNKWRSPDLWGVACHLRHTALTPTQHVGGGFEASLDTTAGM
jgi:hypothetical protein